MTYKHIMVAVDLSEESHLLVEKAIALANPLNAKLSFIHIDDSYAEAYIGFVDIKAKLKEASQSEMQKLVDMTDYPVKHTLVGSGHLDEELSQAIEKYNVDLLVCGHHQNFVSKFISSAKKIINSSPVDMLVVPLNH
ncbi:universal stress protein [Vibrio marisflavi]|uniref:Universal stress protein n=1 Tax=Vibrio marisflavi CECT 7928 TaxID=634439 RepID=A0ABM9A267_9VIBR|nr:universal stress protein [Vibrio marisflavi]CAH0537761.1 Universal stress protein A [Vibrio marisflavi CECT 7928]